jgi:membrane protein
MEHAVKWIGGIRRFFGQDLWGIRTDTLSFPGRISVKYLKIAVLSIQGFRKDRASLRASALTLFSLLSIVPVLAMLFGVAKGFGLGDRFTAWLLAQFPEQQDVVLRQAIRFAEQALEGAEGGVVAGTGVVFLLYSVIKVIGNIEEALNYIWSISKPRSWARKFADYLSLILIGPFLVLGVSSLNVYVSGSIRKLAAVGPYAEFLNPVAAGFIWCLPWLLLWALFTFIYVFLPNTSVKLASGLVGGAMAAIAYQAAQRAYINLQIGVSQTNAIYGSFAAFPLFIIWIQISWNIMLMGAELTQQHQNFSGNELQQHVPNLSFHSLKRLGLSICGNALERYARGQPPPTAESLSSDLNIPDRVVRQMLGKLTAARLLIETVSWEGSDSGYLPARNPDLLTPASVVRGLELLGENLEATGSELPHDRYEELLEDIDRCIEDKARSFRAEDESPS